MSNKFKIEELDVVKLTHSISKYNLRKDERGTVVEVYQNGKAYEVEFVEEDGTTKALLTLMPKDIYVVWKNNKSHPNPNIYATIYSSNAPYAIASLSEHNKIKLITNKNRAKLISSEYHYI